jgi:energy-coupling factor transport system ATP-binding protein
LQVNRLEYDEVFTVNDKQLAVEVSNLRLKFPGESSLIFKDLSFAVPQGQKVLLLGPSGCGKSTLLQVLSGLIPMSIEVPLKYDSIWLPRSWGFVFQDPETQFCMPYVDEELAFVLENLNVPREQMEPLIRESLTSVGLIFEDLHTPIQTLSQGMKQRLALASVLLLQPDVLFLDEPSALLDPEGTEQIFDTIKRVSSSKTMIIVEHKIEQIADWIDRVVLFDDSGNIIADGVPDTVFAKHKDKLIHYGIWYPDVWRDYIENDVYEGLMRERSASRKKCPTGRNLPNISLDRFAGYRGEDRDIFVPAAETHPGEWIAIAGPNGAGKSTLLLSLMQLLRTGGTYLIDGEAVVHRAKKGLFRRGKRSGAINKLAFVFQNPEMQFVTNSVYDEAAYSLESAEGSSGEIDSKVTQLLERFDLAGNGHQHPYQLSVGQKRRLSVASAMAAHQPILLLDEPTFGQDAKNTFAILERLEQLRLQGLTIMMVTHDQYIMNYFADHIWEIEAGKLAAVRKPVQNL